MREGNPEGQDHITGLKAQTNTGRPDWDELFDKIDKPEKHRKVTVFFCGSPVIEEVLKEQCIKRRYKFKAEKFWTDRLVVLINVMTLMVGIQW